VAPPDRCRGPGTLDDPRNPEGSFREGGAPGSVNGGTLLGVAAAPAIEPGPETGWNSSLGAALGAGWGSIAPASGSGDLAAASARQVGGGALRGATLGLGTGLALEPTLGVDRTGREGILLGATAGRGTLNGMYLRRFVHPGVPETVAISAGPAFFGGPASPRRNPARGTPPPVCSPFEGRGMDDAGVNRLVTRPVRSGHP